MKYTIDYISNKKHGKMIEYYNNGKIKSQSTYINDELTDKIVWDIDGNIVED